MCKESLLLQAGVVMFTTRIILFWIAYRKILTKRNAVEHGQDHLIYFLKESKNPKQNNNFFF